MVNLITSTDLSFEDAKNYGIGSINLVKEFLKNLNERNSTHDRNMAIGELDEIISRIESDSNPLRNNADVDAHFTRAIGEIIHCRSAIITQLNNFWDAHLKIAEKAVEQGRSYAIMQMADENREKMVAKLKAMDDKDEHKAANEVHEEMKAKKANTDDPEKEDLKARLKAMEDETKKPMVAKLLKARSSKVSKDELKEYSKSLAAKSYAEVKERYDEQLPLFADSIKDESTPDNSDGFDFNGGVKPLAGKTFAQIAEESN